MDRERPNYQEQLDQSLFFAIARADYESALASVSAGANPNSIFEVTRGVFLSSFNLFITKAAQLGQAKGAQNALYLTAMKLMKALIPRASLECKCLKEHKCPMYIALEAFRISSEEDLLSCKCDLPRYLAVSGATLKFEPKQDTKASKQLAKWSLRWLDLEGLRNYLVTKNFNYLETKIEL